MKEQAETREQALQSINSQTNNAPQQQQETLPVDQSAMAEQGRQLKEQSENSPQAQQGRKMKAGAQEHADKNGPKRNVNKTGIPDRLKTVIEYFSGFSLDEVRVHYNSEKPALVDAHAYTEGLHVYVAPGQEKHLAHELWHVVQQMKGEAKATETVNGKKVDTRKGKEQEADKNVPNQVNPPTEALEQTTPQEGIIQRVELTDDEITARLAPLGNGLTLANSQILTRWDKDWGDDHANCHGYTLNQDATHFNYPDEMLAGIGAGAQVAVFMSGDKIAHSGIYDGGKVTHLLKRIGILESNVGINGTMGYTTRYNLPADRAALDAALAATAAAEAAAALITERIDLSISILDHAKSIDGEIRTALGADYNAAVNIGALDAIDSDAAKDAYITLHQVYINRIRVYINENEGTNYDEV